MSAAQCPECHGLGYDLFSVDREPGLEIERVDGCNCLWLRLNEALAPISSDYEPTDDDAAVMFVRDLERGMELAVDLATRLCNRPATTKDTTP